jgi:amino acid adenylation domain-containing protein
MEFRLTPLQQSMVLASLRSPGSGLYVVQDICELREPVDAQALKTCWDRLAERHAALRTVIGISGAEWRQRVLDFPRPEWQDLDWTGAGEQGRMLAEFLDRDRASGFDFSRVPLRLTLIRRACGEGCMLVWTSHHALLDGWSLALLWREWFQLYDSLRRGTPIALPAAPPFWAHATWLREHVPAGSEAFWRERLAGLTRTTGFLVDRLRREGAAAPAGQERATARFSQAETAALEDFARDHDATLNTLVQAAWALLLSRYSGSADIVFGVTRAGRHSGVPHADQIAGLLINTLPARLQADPSRQVLSWLAEIRRSALLARPYELSSIPQIWEWCGLPGALPPFDTMLVYDYETLHGAARNWGEAWEERSLRRIQKTDLPLTLAAYARPALALDLIYDPRRFTAETMGRAAVHLRTLLLGLMRHSGGRLVDIPMLAEEERQWLLHGVKVAAAPVPDVCAHSMFEDWARKRPDWPALESIDGSLSFGDANREANRRAWALRESGARPEDLVAICLDQPPLTVLAVLAVLKAGAAFVVLDPEMPPERLAAMLAETHPKFVIACAATRGRLPAAPGLLDWVEMAQASPHAGEDPPRTAGPDHAAYAVYTSGSTGTPKAVLITHRSLVNIALELGRIFGLRETDRRLQLAAQGSELFLSEIFTYLSAGMTLVFGREHIAGSMESFLRFLEEHAITVAGMPASWWHEWMALLAAGRPAPSQLRLVIAGMERVNPEALAAWRRWAPPGVRWFNVYGPTECTFVATAYEAGASVWEDTAVPIGSPVANTAAYVLDANGELCPVGVPGELYLGGTGVALGYLNAPELTARKFLPDPFRGCETRMYRTGDIVYLLPDGKLVFVGRADLQVKIRGHRIELEDVEAGLSRHPDIQLCAAALRGGALAVWFVPTPGRNPTLEELRRHAARVLPPHMIPALFRRVERLPLTSNGKIDHQALERTPAVELVPSRPFAGASTMLERLLAEVFGEALERASPGIHDDFFELGGDSLRAAVLLRLIEDRLGARIGMDLLFKTPTVGGLAAALENGAASASVAPPIELFQSEGSGPAIFCISSMPHNAYLFRPLAQHLPKDRPFWAVANPMRPGAAFADDAREALAAIREVRSQGPYAIGGFCYGGVLAHEVARQLCDAGQDVRLLVLFDAWPPGYPKLWRWSNLRRLWPTLRQIHSDGIEWDEVAGHAKSLGRVFLALGQRAAARVSPPPAKRGAPGWVVRAGGGRIPDLSAIPVPILHFVAGQADSPRFFEDPRFLWGELSTKGCETIRVEGGHDWVLSGSSGAAIAQRLQEALARALDNGQPPQIPGS